MTTAEVRAEVRAEIVDGVATLTIDRPERRNAMSFAVMAALRDTLAAWRDDPEVRVVVLTGAGDRAFCAGADLGGIADNASPAEVHAARGALADVFRNLDRLGKPTIARVRGFALAGGFGLACACDIVIAADDAVFGAPEVDVGLWPYMITVPLVRSMPPKVVLELMMTGRRVDAHEAERLGFVNRVVAVADLDATVDEYCRTLVAKSPLVLRLGRDAFYRTLDIPDADDALAYLHAMLSVHTTSDDAAEGVAAFAEKRAPRWTGR
jgi:enoyl-CoA hydratase/carnithine racemase